MDTVPKLPGDHKMPFHFLKFFIISSFSDVGGEQMATQECGTGKAEIMKNLKTEGVA